MGQSWASLPESVSISPVRLSPTELDRLLDDLDEAETVPRVDKRRHERLACRCTGVVVIVNQQGYESTFWIPLRDVSQGGIAFLHRSMLHAGTECTVRIRTPDRKWVQVDGKVVRSRYVQKMVYEIGLRFDSDIDGDGLNLLMCRPNPDAHKS